MAKTITGPALRLVVVAAMLGLGAAVLAEGPAPDRSGGAPPKDGAIKPLATSQPTSAADASAGLVAPGNDILTICYGRKIRGRVLLAIVNKDSKDTEIVRGKLAGIELSPDKLALGDGTSLDGPLVAIRFSSVSNPPRLAKFKRDEIVALTLDAKPLATSQPGGEAISEPLAAEDVDKQLLAKNNELYSTYLAKSKDAARKDLAALAAQDDSQMNDIQTRGTTASNAYDASKADADAAQAAMDKARARATSGGVGSAQARIDEGIARRNQQAAVKKMTTAQSDVTKAQADLKKLQDQDRAEKAKIGARSAAQAAGLHDVLDKHSFVLFFGGKLTEQIMDKNYAAEMSAAPAAAVAPAAVPAAAPAAVPAPAPKPKGGRPAGPPNG